MTDWITLSIVMLLLLVAKGFFSGSELALISADKSLMRRRAAKGDRRAALVLKLFERPEALLATTLIGTNIATMSLSVLAAATVIRAVGQGGELYAVAVVAPIMLIFGEIVPKSIFQQQADIIAPRVAPVFAVLRWVLSPVVGLLGGIARIITRRIAPEKQAVSPFVTRQRLKLALEKADAPGGEILFDRERLRRAIRLADMSVGEAMTPLSRVKGVDVTAPFSDVLAAGRNGSDRAVPLYDGNLSNIVAIAVWNVWDEATPGFHSRPVEELHVAPHYVSPLERLDGLLPVLLSRRDHMAIVVDEYGTARGVVTVERMMSILLGDVAKGTRVAPLPADDLVKPAPMPGGGMLYDADIGLAELADRLDVDMPEREFHSLGGFLTGKLRRIPKQGDVIDALEHRFTVEEATARGATRVRVERLG